MRDGARAVANISDGIILSIIAIFDHRMRGSNRFIACNIFSVEGDPGRRNEISGDTEIGCEISQLARIRVVNNTA